MSELTKPFLKKNQMKKTKKKQKINVKMLLGRKKPLVRCVILILTKKLDPE